MFRSVLLTVALVISALLMPISAGAQSSRTVYLEHMYFPEGTTINLTATSKPVESSLTITYDNLEKQTRSWQFDGQFWQMNFGIVRCGVGFTINFTDNPKIVTQDIIHLDSNRFIITLDQCPAHIAWIAIPEAAPGEMIGIYGYNFTEGLPTIPDNDLQVCFDSEVSTCVHPNMNYWKPGSIRLELPTTLQPNSEYHVTVVKNGVPSQPATYQTGDATFPSSPNHQIIGYDNTNNTVYTLSSSRMNDTAVSLTINSMKRVRPWRFDGIDWFASFPNVTCNTEFAITPLSEFLYPYRLSNQSGRFRIEPSVCIPAVNTINPNLIVPGQEIFLFGDNFTNGRTTSDPSGLRIVITNEMGIETLISGSQISLWQDNIIGFRLPSELSNGQYNLTVIRDSTSSRSFSFQIGIYRTYLPALTR